METRHLIERGHPTPTPSPRRCAQARATSMRTMEERRQIAAPVEARILALINAAATRPGSNASIPGAALPRLYEERHGMPLDVAALGEAMGMTAVPALNDLLRGNIFPELSVHGNVNKGGWYVSRMEDQRAKAEKIPMVQDGILELLRKDAPLDAGALPELLGRAYKRRFDFRDFGCKSMRAFLERCDKLCIVMRKDKMLVFAKNAAGGIDKEWQQGKRKREDNTRREEAPAQREGAQTAAPSAGSSAPALTAAASAAATPSVEDDAAAAKAARKAAKRAKRAAEAGLTEAEAEAAHAAAKEQRKAKKAAGKEKKRAWLEAHGKPLGK